jgi:hypothetical protein
MRTSSRSLDVDLVREPPAETARPKTWPRLRADPRERREATTFPDAIADDIRKRTLGFDDIKGVCAIYPRLDAPTSGAAVLLLWRRCGPAAAAG